MCGIFGVVGRELSQSALECVFGALHHRGPDGRGAYRDGSVGLTLAHTRLAIIDPATGAQPLQSEDGELVLVANGEIYDFERIRTSLEAKGHRFATGSDSEVILYLYREHGLGCFEHLRGEFAFLLYDRPRKLLIAARDRFGIKPLYCSRVDKGFVFASEMKALFASGIVTPKLDAAGLDPLLDRDPVSPRLPFERVEHVPPGCYLAVDLETDEVKLTRYWSDEIADLVPDQDPAACALSVLDELEQAVRLRLRADVPVGLYLSGGVDSAFIAALMRRNLQTRPHSFSISFEGSSRNEREFAMRAAEAAGTEHHDIAVTRQMLWRNLDQALWFSELPFVTLAPVGKYLLSEEAKKFVTVVLTGEGADEVFLGYRAFFERAMRGGARTRRAPWSVQSQRLKLGAVSAALSLLMFHRSKRGQLRASRAPDQPGPATTKPPVNALQEARLAAMPFDILCYLGDREEMAHSLEARLPFLDHRLYDLARTIPADLKLRDGVEKAVLRDAATGILPDDLRLRRKTGFMLTSDAVDLFGDDRDYAAALRPMLTREAFERAGIFSWNAYRAAWLAAKLPPRTRRLKRIRRGANKLIMYMMQVHMLHDQFIANPRWKGAAADRAAEKEQRQPAYA